MADKVVWTLNAEILGGPKVVLPPQSIGVEGYSKTDVVIPGDGLAKKVVLLPPGGKALFLLITSSRYDAKLTYKPKAATTAIVLDSPQVFTGGGSLALAGDLESLEFTNKLGAGNDALVSILFGFDATP